MLKLTSDISYEDIEKNLDLICSWNKYVKPGNITKHKGDTGVRWFGLWEKIGDGEYCLVAICCVREDYPLSVDVYLNTLAASSGYGGTMTRYLHAYYQKHKKPNWKWIGFTSDPEAGPKLLEHYKAILPDWTQYKNKFGWNCFKKRI